MADEISVLNANITLTLLKKNFIICSYPGKIVFGEVTKQTFVNKKSFVIHRRDFTEFYLGIVNLVSSFSSDSDLPETKGIFFATEDYTYYWSQNFDCIFFGIEINSENIFRTCFTLEEFYNLLHYFEQLILSCLLLGETEVDLFKKICNLSLKEILDLTNNENNETNFLQHQELSKVKIPHSIITILLKNNIDIIVIIHKLKTLSKSNFNDFVKTNLTMLLK